MFWIILAQNFNIERIVVGLIICIVIYSFNMDLLKTNEDDHRFSMAHMKYSLLHVAILIKEIFKSNFHVAKIVLSPKLNISPSVVTIDTKLKSDFNKTILANSITLTPGTLTLDVFQDRLLVHCLDVEAAKGIVNNSFESILLKKEESNNE
jgi:multicomponent Na+:H+ antiporter subunit E